MNSERRYFTNEIGIKIAAILDRPLNQKPIATAIFAHCFTCSKNLTAVKNISRALTLQGICVLRFDFTGLGESDGDFEQSTFSNNVNDLVAAAKFIATETEEKPSILIGHSLGGAAVLLAADKIPSIKAVATIGAPYSPDHVTHLFSNSIERINTDGLAEVALAGRKFTITKDFVDDLSNNGLQSVIKNLKRSLLVMHSPQDNTVGIENAALIYQEAMHPKSFVSLDGADHLLSSKKDSMYVGEVISSWAKRYLDLEEKAKLSTHKDVVVRTDHVSFTSDVLAGIHNLTADEPEEVGGNNYGPAPYDFLSIGLAACTSMTLQMYAKRKKWDLKEANVHVSHNKDYSKDQLEEENPSAKIDIFEREIELIGNLDEEQRNRLLQIADKCPVHKTLHSEVKVRTTEKGIG